MAQLLVEPRQQPIVGKEKQELVASLGQFIVYRRELKLILLTMELQALQALVAVGVEVQEDKVMPLIITET